MKNQDEVITVEKCSWCADGECLLPAVGGHCKRLRIGVQLLQILLLLVMEDSRLLRSAPELIVVAPLQSVADHYSHNHVLM